eukprot:11258110-Karenia_brevis.AAC.1
MQLSCSQDRNSSEFRVTSCHNEQCHAHHAVVARVQRSMTPHLLAVTVLPGASHRFVVHIAKRVLHLLSLVT